jgi:hypothetical protein
MNRLAHLTLAGVLVLIGSLTILGAPSFLFQKLGAGPLFDFWTMMFSFSCIIQDGRPTPSEILYYSIPLVATGVASIFAGTHLLRPFRKSRRTFAF